MQVCASLLNNNCCRLIINSGLINDCLVSLLAARLFVMDGGEEVRVEAAPYCFSACDGGEVAGRSLTRRNRKTRSLSTSSAGSSEYRWELNMGNYGLGLRCI